MSKSCVATKACSKLALSQTFRDDWSPCVDDGMQGSLQGAVSYRVAIDELL